MGTIQMLDCTLRDGGYCNDCRFGLDNQRRITAGLAAAGVEIIECGFLLDRVLHHPDVTRFTHPEQIGAVLPRGRGAGRAQYVALADYGKYDFSRLPSQAEAPIQGIRVAFHKKDRRAALEACRTVREKGYQVFVQPMVSVSYTEGEFLDLIARVNGLQPYAFYIVDSFGTLQRGDLLRLFRLAETHLDPAVKIGFHPHNNLQLAFANAQALVEQNSPRDLIVDSSVYGMGRGAGNLNTELFARYLNDRAGASYRMGPLLDILDGVVLDFYRQNPWGYSAAHYLSASHQAHPDYGSYLEGKKTLTAREMDEILAGMDPEKRRMFDPDYIEELYRAYRTEQKGRAL